jgi:hypothetical protein
MAGILDNLLARMRGRKVSPTETVGAPGTAVLGGFIQSNEKNAKLSGEKRYQTFSNILANVSIVAAGTRYFLNLTAKAGWTLEPTDHPESDRLTDLVSTMLFDDPATPWHRIVRRAAMYRFYGFSIQEWTARRREDGLLTFADIAPRAQFTIERWDLNEDGSVEGMIQRSPQTQREIFLPRQKTLYIVDDTLSDSPEGLGLFRHLVEPSDRLNEYLRLEGIGLETDLRGVPIGRGPFQKLSEMEQSGEINRTQRIALEQPLRDFVTNHVKTAKTGMLLDSMTYEAKDEAGRASNQPQWNVDLLQGSSTSLPDIANAISRLNHDMARVLGVEFLLLGGDSAGSFALSRDKTNQFSLLIDSTLKELAESIQDDLIKTLWQLNGWPIEAMPKAKTEEVKFRDVEQIAEALRAMAASGAMLAPDDPVINDVRALLGVSPQPEPNELDLALTGDREIEGSPDNPDDDLPEDETDNEE